jgi:hypothetical protein
VDAFRDGAFGKDEALVRLLLCGEDGVRTPGAISKGGINPAHSSFTES